MQRLEVSGAVRLIYKSLGVKGLKNKIKLKFCSYVCLLEKPLMEAGYDRNIFELR